MKVKGIEGITLIVLVITIIILLILVGITVATLTGDNGILNKTNKASEKTDKQTATEIINLKITEAQIGSYAEEQQMPSLQFLADSLCEDEEIEYVELTTQKIASVKEAKLKSITVGQAKSIFTKLKEYPYEFEIDGSLTLVSMDDIETGNNNIEQEDYEELLKKMEFLETEINALKSNSLRYEQKFLWESTSINSGGSNQIYEIEKDGIYYVEVMALMDSGNKNLNLQTLIQQNEKKITGNYDRWEVTYPTCSCNAIIDAKKGDRIIGYIYSSDNITSSDNGTFRVKVIQIQ